MNIIKIQQPMRVPYFTIKNYMLTPCNTKFIGTYNNRTFVWDAITGKVIKELNMILENDCIFTTDGKKIVSNGWKTYQPGLRVFDYEDETLIS